MTDKEKIELLKKGLTAAIRWMRYEYKKDLLELAEGRKVNAIHHHEYSADIAAILAAERVD